MAYGTADRTMGRGLSRVFQGVLGYFCGIVLPIARSGDGKHGFCERGSVEVQAAFIGHPSSDANSFVNQMLVHAPTPALVGQTTPGEAEKRFAQKGA